MPQRTDRGSRLGTRLALCLALAALSTGCAANRLWAPGREEVVRRILPSTVQVVVEQGGRRFRSGSGVVIASNPSAQGVGCYVLTSGHTLARPSEGDAQVYVLLGQHRGAGTKVPATVLAQVDTDDLDLGLLHVTSSQCATARLGTPPTLGEEIWVVAFPWGRNLTLVSGIISQINQDPPADGENASRLMVDASVSYGASGGGVYEARSGRLIGLVEGYPTARVSFRVDAYPGHIDVPVPGETYITPLAHIRRFLTQAGYAGLLRRSAPRATQSL